MTGLYKISDLAHDIKGSKFNPIHTHEILTFDIFLHIKTALNIIGK